MLEIGRKICILLIVAVTTTLTPTESTKWLIDNPGFDSIDAWVKEYLPCARQDIVFPEDYNAILPLPKEVEVNGFVLPRDGAILFDQDSTINFGSGPKKRECIVSSHNAYLKKPTPRKWFNPYSWRTTAAMTRNLAVPHMERAPCNNESVIIQRKGPIAIDLENVPYLRLGQMSLAGSIISKDYLRHLLNTEIGQILFQNSRGLTIEYYRDDVCGCHRDFATFIDPICSSVYGQCERPRCLSRILPYESCCKICGALLQFTINGCDDGSLHKLTKLISIAVTNQGLSNEIDFYVSYINAHILQAVFVDRNEYSEKSVAFVHRLNVTTDWTKVFSRSLPMVLKYSGRPHYGGVTFGSIVLIILCMALVAYVALVIVAHYAPDNRYVNMISPWLLEPRRWQRMFTRSHFVFARFQNTGAGGGAVTVENVDNLTMRFHNRNSAVEECAFDNPMFNRGGEVRSNDGEDREPNTETQSLASISIDPVGETTTKHTDIEERELTEIKLEPSSDSSDEDETRE